MGILGDEYKSNEESAGEKLKNYLKKLLIDSTFGRMMIEASRMVLVAAVLYMIFSWIGELLIILIKMTKFILANC